MHRLFLVFLLAVPFINGCAPLVVGGAAATGVVVAEDRRTVGTMTEDQTIEFKASSRIDDKAKGAHVSVTSYNRMVLLTGEVPDAAAKATAEKIAQAVDNVRGVFNELQVAANSALSARANDAYITSLVKARFVDAQRFSPVHVKVVTEASVVYLMGLVMRKEADAATEVARTTRGVHRVVRVFEYLD
ncbi:MAG: BON domain-containing protein [Betaproteobacteria bacterium]|nr:BON domain-containing protein [Betaproteobacteria bacterium]